MNHATHDAPACVREIANLLAWCRRLSERGPGNADPAELAAYQQAKHQLLARLTHDTDAGEGGQR
ncbi:hypothetical protein ACFLIM_49980 [Nonomuraea sp. M3C6]|uniref:Uncharacterized protein n=1 Tax=Nonomuraea marmarensis TaxID=3351344 RepID=A0ABW7AV53_9ACTN